MTEPEETWKDYREIFGKLGVKKVEWLDVRVREEGFKDRRERARLLGSFGRTLAHEMRNSLGAGEAY